MTVWCTRPKLYHMTCNARACSRFSSFFEKGLVRRVNRRILCYFTYDASSDLDQMKVPSALGAMVGLIVGLILAFFWLGNYWVTVLDAILIGAGIGILVQVFSWVSKFLRRRSN